MPSPISIVSLARDFRRSVANWKSGSIRVSPGTSKRGAINCQSGSSSATKARRHGAPSPSRLVRLCLFGRLGVWADRRFRRPAGHGSGGKGRRTAVGISHCGDLRRRRRDHFALGHARRPRERAQAARTWAEAFCASATRNFRWNRRWKLVVYTQGQPHPSHSCLIPTPANDPRKSSEGRVTRDDDGGAGIAPVDD